MSAHLHLIKLSVGTEDMADLTAWQQQKRVQTADGFPRHTTRMWPRRGEELLDGGSIYWVIKGLVLCRQKVLRLDRVTGQDGIERCAIVLDPELVRVAPVQRQPFQGWRYLKAEDAPPDLTAPKPGEDALPLTLSRALAEIGVI